MYETLCSLGALLLSARFWAWYVGIEFVFLGWGALVVFVPSARWADSAMTWLIEWPVNKIAWNLNEELEPIGFAIIVLGSPIIMVVGIVHRLLCGLLWILRWAVRQ